MTTRIKYRLPQYLIDAGFTCGRLGYRVNRVSSPRKTAKAGINPVNPKQEAEYQIKPQDPADILRVTIEKQIMA